MISKHVACLIALLKVIGICSVTGVQWNEERRLSDALFSDYDTLVRPVVDSTKSVQVKLSFELHSIVELDEINQVMYVTGFVVAQWTDRFLVWDPAKYGGLKAFIAPPYKIWLPDFGIINSADTFYHDSFTNDFRVRIHNDGTIDWLFGGQFATKCELDLTYYPFDRQQCNMTMENWAYSGPMVNLVAVESEVHLEDYHMNGEWTLERTQVDKSYAYHDLLPGEVFPRITFHLFLQRKPGYYVLNIMLPCLFMIVLALMVFWMPVESGEKIGLGVTILLAFSVFMFIIADHTPKSSDFTPILSIFVAGVMAFSALSVFSSIIIIHLHITPSDKRPPAAIRALCFRYLARAMCMRTQVPDVDDFKVDPDRVIELHPKHTDKPKGDNKSDDVMSEISHNLAYIADHVQRTTQSQSIEEEWRGVAAILDRLLFWFFLVFMFCFTVVMLIQEDEHH